ncbi:MAG: CRISPR-associated endonuclease Cas2 [Thermodesulfobacteriota bacterium]
MFVILVYDVGQKRVAKVLKTARKYLNWVQNSVLEGDLTMAQYERLKDELSDIIKERYDSLIFYTFRTKKYSKRESIGVKKGGEEMFI